MRAKYVSGPRLSATTGSTFELQRVPAVRREEPPLRREEVDEERRDEERWNGEAEVREEHQQVVGDAVRAQRGEDAERDADDDREQHREAAELRRDREVLLHDRVHVLVPQDERRAEIERRDVLDVLEVLLVPGLVEPELPVEVREHRRRHGALGLPEGAALDRPHHQERHEDDEEDDRDRPEDAADDELQHSSGSFLCRGGVNPAGGRSARPPGDAVPYDMPTLVRSIVSIGFVFQPVTLSATWYANVYQ